MEWESSSSGEVMGGGGGGPGYVAATGNVMTEEQIHLLQKQISIYGTLSQQLADMHSAQAAQHDSTAEVNLGALYAGDPIMMVPGAGGEHRLAARHRWTPTPTQLVILEGIFDEGHGTPNKQRIKDIAAELSRHGHISETNVYNWFQNRRARWRRRRQQAATAAAASSLPNASSNAESEADAAAASQYDGSSNNASSISGASGDWDHLYFYDSIDHAEPCTGFDEAS